MYNTMLIIVFLVIVSCITSCVTVHVLLSRWLVQYGNLQEELYKEKLELTITTTVNQVEQYLKHR